MKSSNWLCPANSPKTKNFSSAIIKMTKNISKCSHSRTRNQQIFDSFCLKIVGIHFFSLTGSSQAHSLPCSVEALLPNSTNTSILFHLFYIVCDFLWCLPVRQSRWISVPYPAACRLRPCPTVLGVKRWQVQSVKDSAQASHLWIMFLFSHQVWPQCILLWDEGVVFSVRHD